MKLLQIPINAKTFNAFSENTVSTTVMLVFAL